MIAPPYSHAQGKHHPLLMKMTLLLMKMTHASDPREKKNMMKKERKKNNNMEIVFTALSKVVVKNLMIVSMIVSMIVVVLQVSMQCWPNVLNLESLSLSLMERRKRLPNRAHQRKLQRKRLLPKKMSRCIR